MSWAQEIKDFVAGADTGSKMSARWDAGSKKSTKEAEAAAEKARVEAAGEAGVAAAQKRAGSGTPGSDSSGSDDMAGDSVGGSTEVETKFIDTAKQAVTNPFGLAALAATGRAESSWKPTALAGSWSDPSESGKPGVSGGALSWRNERLEGLRKTAGYNTPEGNAQYFINEAKQTGLLDKLNNAKSLDEAMTAMNNAWAFKGYNRPGNKEVARRRGYAEQYYKRYGGGQQAQAVPTGDAVGDDEKLTLYGASGGYVDPEDLDDNYDPTLDPNSEEYDPAEAAAQGADISGATDEEPDEPDTSGGDTLTGKPLSRSEPAVTPQGKPAAVPVAAPAKATAPATPAKAAPRTAVPASSAPQTAPGQQDSTTSDKAGSGAETGGLLFPKEQLTNVGSASDAVAAGLRYIQNMFTGGAGVPEAAEDRAKKVSAFARNEGAPTPNDMKEVDRIIDPKNELDPNVKGIARLNGMYQYYMSKGDSDKASKVAASMLMYTRQAVMNGGAHIQALIEKGNREGAAKVANEVAAAQANGQTLNLKAMPEGDFAYKITDDETGRLTGGGRLAVNEVLRLANGWQDGSSWFEDMAGMAGRSRSRGTSTASRPRAPARGTQKDRDRAEAEAAARAEEERTRATIAGKAAELGVGGAPAAVPPATPAAPVPNAPNAPAAVSGAPVAPVGPAAVPRTAVPTGVTPQAPVPLAPPTPQQLTPQPLVGKPLPGGPATAGQGAPLPSQAVPLNPEQGYPTPLGPRRTLPEEAQAPLAEAPLEQEASRIAVDAERRGKIRQLGQGAVTDQILKRADQAYAAATTQKNVRRSDTNKSREEISSGIDTGYGEIVTPGKEYGENESAIDKKRRPMFNTIGSAIIKANEGMVPEDVGRQLGKIMKHGYRLNQDGTVQANRDPDNADDTDGPRMIVNGKTVRMIDQLHGGKSLASVAGVNTKLTPRKYSLPPAAQGTGKRRYTPEEEEMGRAMATGSGMPHVPAGPSPEPLSSEGPQTPEQKEIVDDIIRRGRDQRERLARAGRAEASFAGGPEQERNLEAARIRDIEAGYPQRAAEISADMPEMERDRERQYEKDLIRRRRTDTMPELERGREALRVRDYESRYPQIAADVSRDMPEMERDREIGYRARQDQRNREAWATGPEADRTRENERELAERDRRRYLEQESWKLPPDSVRGEDAGIVAAIRDGVGRYIRQALGSRDEDRPRSRGRDYVDYRRDIARRRAVQAAVPVTDYDELEGERRSAINLGPQERDYDRERGRSREEYSKRR